MRHYATTDEGKRFLYELECDGCGKRAKPGSEDLLENWTKHGQYTAGRDEGLEWMYCGDCPTVQR